MSANDDVNEALSNLSAIKDGQDPREEDTPSVPDGVNTEPPTRSQAEQIISDMKYEVMRTLQEYPVLQEHVSLDQLTFYVAEWKGRRGAFWANHPVEGDEYGARINSDDFPHVKGEHSIGLSRRVHEDDNEWEATVRHELAHAVAYEKYGSCQGHNDRFQKINERIGGTKDAEDLRDFDYAVSCPEGCVTWGRVRRSKTIKKPWKMRCTDCGSVCVSHDYDDPVPKVKGSCKVESIPWDNRTEYRRHDGGL